MKKYMVIISVLFSMLLIFSQCSDYVEGVDERIDLVQDDQLNNVSQVDFLVNGVYTRFATTVDQHCALGDLLSDAFFYSNDVPGASFPSFEEIDVGDILLDNNSVDNCFDDLGELRFFADDLIRRVNTLDFSQAQMDKKNKALHTGYFFGGFARFFYAAYWGLSEDQGGGVINAGPFISSEVMYDSAVVFLTKSMEYTEDPWEIKVAHSLIARIYLAQNAYSQAATHANQGLAEGDAPFQSLYTAETDNYWWGYAGAGRTQFVCDFRFNDYVTENPEEEARIKIVAIPDDPKDNDGVDMYYRQDIYPDKTNPIDYITWQEMALTLADVDLQNGDSGSALSKVNAVRTSHGISALDSIDEDGLLIERDKEFFTRGLRVLDQRRKGKWHLGSGRWKYLPITQNERNQNPNID